MRGLKNNGFSLIEVLVAMLILVIGLLAVSSIQSNSARQNTTARQLSQAVFLIQEEMERCMSTDYDDMDSLNGTTVVGDYTLTTSIDTNASLKNISVSVGFQGHQIEYYLRKSDSY